MSYDGFYSGLSSRGTASEILNLAIATKDELLPIAADMEEAKVATVTALQNIEKSQASAAASSETAVSAAQESATARDEAKWYADAATYKFVNVNVEESAIAVNTFKDFPLVTTEWPAVFYRMRVDVSNYTDDIMYDVEAKIGTNIVYKSEALVSDLVDSIPFFTTFAGPMVVRITNRGRASFVAALSSTFSQVGNAK